LNRVSTTIHNSNNLSHWIYFDSMAGWPPNILA
jgi:hypothetical protein